MDLTMELDEMKRDEEAFCVGVRVDKNLSATMRDGVVLRANVFQLEEGGPYPVLLTRLPYGKDTAMAYAVADPIRLAEAGYIVVIQDVRGCFSSEGQFSGFPQEFNDGYDTVEWAAKLPNANGSVGMYGASYFAFTQVAAAATNPPSLKTMAPTDLLTDPFEGVAYRNGALEWGTMAAWYGAMMSMPELMRTARGNADFPTQMGMLINEIDHLGQEGYYQLPLTAFSPLRRTGLFPFVFEFMEHNTKSSFWDPMMIQPHIPNMNVSAQVVGGWFDVFQGSTIQFWKKLREAGQTAQLWIGPWTHTNKGFHVGDVYFGVASNIDTLDLKSDRTALHIRWFDSQLKGSGAGDAGAAEAPVHYFVMGENRWKTASDWPLPGTQFTPFYLGSDGDARTAKGDGSLSTKAPEGAGEGPAGDGGTSGSVSDTYVYDPGNPVTTHGGNFLMASPYEPGPKSQERIESREDVLVYTSDPLTDPLEVVGPVQAELWVSSSAVDTDFVVRLTDVDAEGRSINLADGIVRMRFRDTLHEEHLMEPGTVYPITVDCWSTGHVFLPGHRVRVQVTSSNFPRWNRNLNTGASNENTAEYVSATQQVYHDAEHPSHIVLPVIPRG